MYCGVMVSRNSQPAGQAHLGEIQKQAARDRQPLVHLERAVEVRVVDEPLPPDGRAGLLEVDAHDDEQRVRQLGRDRLQTARVLAGRRDVVNGTGADHDQQAVVLAAQDAGGGLAALGHGRGRPLAEREVLHQDLGRDQGADAFDAQIVGGAEHAGRRNLACFCSRCARTGWRRRGILRRDAARSGRLCRRRAGLARRDAGPRARLPPPAGGGRGPLRRPDRRDRAGRPRPGRGRLARAQAAQPLPPAAAADGGVAGRGVAGRHAPPAVRGDRRRPAQARTRRPGTGWRLRWETRRLGCSRISRPAACRRTRPRVPSPGCGQPRWPAAPGRWRFTTWAAAPA